LSTSLAVTMRSSSIILQAHIRCQCTGGMPPVPTCCTGNTNLSRWHPEINMIVMAVFQGVPWMMMACYHLFILVIFVSMIVVMTALSVKYSVWLQGMRVFTVRCRGGCCQRRKVSGIFGDAKSAAEGA